MAGYVKDPNNSEKQTSRPLPDNAYDRALTTTTCSFFKTPNAVYFNVAPTENIKFFFGSSASFSALATSEGPGQQSGSLTGSQHYQNFGKPPVGTMLNIHPTAWSGSKADEEANCITLIYKSGFSTGRV